MTKREATAERFYIDDHAVLFACLARRAEELAGERGTETIVRAIVVYGRERGLRGAMRCLADGEPLSGKNYILYGEWADPRGWSRSEVAATAPHYRTNMTVCGWCESWEKHGLLEYGRLYCDWVDANLVYGFNPALRLEMPKTLSRGEKCCTFDWLDCTFGSEAEAEAMAARRAELIPRVTKDFLYHCGHLLSTFRRELLLEFGLVKGEEIVGRALGDYGELFEEEKAQSVVQESRQNFLQAAP